jgi:energy-coupling factor transporter ATP-binding protein EcfA2
LSLDWDHIALPAPILADSRHPYAADLNLIGNRSLHQLLDTCVSMGGSQCLAGWLLNPVPNPPEIAERQALTRELIARPAFCARLELDGLLANPRPGNRWDASVLLHWLEKRVQAGSLRPLLVVLGLLALVDISLFVLNALHLLPPLWIGTLVIYLALQSMKFRESSDVFGEAYSLAHQLRQLRTILGGLESYPYDPGSQLAGLCAPFWQAPVRPSVALRKIGWIVSAASLRNNPFLSLILNILVPWDMFFPDQLEKYKRELQVVLPAWLEVWYDLEGLAALANYARLNPENTFPVILPLDNHPVFHAKAIGHPLITRAARVTNDFTLQHAGEVVVITGSNMSGKSTFLRTLGINLALAYTGSTVTANALSALPFRLYTSMTVTDSLSDGISFFYAEVNRLKSLLDQLNVHHPLPLFFLIDEIFRGTNNRERQIGSHAYTQALVNKNGVGLISTHDLELVHLAETIPTVHNYHFREDVQDGRMVFDYQIRTGASPTTNALRIMALAGLPVDGENQTSAN